MKLVTWKDRDGRKHQSWIKNDDPDRNAQNGIPNDPPSIDGIDWEAVKTQIHNMLVDAGATDFMALQRNQGVMNQILAVIKRSVWDLYQNHQQAQKAILDK